MPKTTTRKPQTKKVVDIKRKKVALALIENGGSVSAAMVKAGYTPAYAKNPQKLTESQSWKELMEKYLPDSLLAEKHNALLNKKEFMIIRSGKEAEVTPTGEIDPNAVAKGLDMAYKIKGTYAPEKLEHAITSVEVVKYTDAKDKITN